MFPPFHCLACLQWASSPQFHSRFFLTIWLWEKKKPFFFVVIWTFWRTILTTYTLKFNNLVTTMSSKYWRVRVRWKHMLCKWDSRSKKKNVIIDKYSYGSLFLRLKAIVKGSQKLFLSHSLIRTHVALFFFFSFSFVFAMWR